MIPAAILVAIMGAAIGLWLIAHANKTGSTDREVRREVAELTRRVDALRAAIDDLLIGHVNEPRLKRALSRIFEDEEEPAPRTKRSTS